MADKKAIVKNADMSEEMQCEAIERATEVAVEGNASPVLTTTFLP